MKAILLLMNLIEQINQHRYLYLTEIGEPIVNTLRVEIEEATVGSDAEADIPGMEGTNYGPITSDETCNLYEVLFESYVAYAVLNECYASGDKSEKFTGTHFRVYSKSNFLDYIQAATLASEDYPGKFTHYEIACLDHVVEIVSVDEPKIRILRRGVVT